MRTRTLASRLSVQGLEDVDLLRCVANALEECVRERSGTGAQCAHVERRWGQVFDGTEPERLMQGPAIGDTRLSKAGTRQIRARQVDS